MDLYPKNGYKHSQHIEIILNEHSRGNFYFIFHIRSKAFIPSNKNTQRMQKYCKYLFNNNNNTKLLQVLLLRKMLGTRYYLFFIYYLK